MRTQRRHYPKSIKQGLTPSLPDIERASTDQDAEAVQTAIEKVKLAKEWYDSRLLQEAI